MLAHLQALGVDGECCDDVILALDEACANVVRHAFPGLPGTYSVTAVLRPDDVVIVVEDHGQGMDPTALLATRAQVDPEATSGRGLYLMRQLMSSVEVEAGEGGRGTRVRMRKKLRSAPPGPGLVAGALPGQGLAGTRPPAGLYRDPMF
jgi:serine/threonine-protein kinase RsbW